MKVIKLTADHDKTKLKLEPIVLALGFFDGVHQGHRAVILKAKQKAQQLGLKLAVMTFDRYPKLTYQKLAPKDVTYLTKTPAKLAIFEQLGVDFAYVLEFNERIAKLLPKDFVDNYINALQAKCVVAGQDYTFGKPNIANMTTLKEYAQNKFEVLAVSDLNDQEGKISSTRIRNAIDQGQITVANQLLGAPYQFSGEVVHGDARGRLIGFKTLNIAYEKDQRLLAVGVYAVKVKIGDTWYYGVGNIGRNETFGANRKLTVEIYVFDFNQEIYGQIVTVQWHAFLRPTVKFKTVDDLINQLKQDEQNGRKYFGMC